MSTQKKDCPNCGFQLTIYHNFCPNCGQKVDDKLNMRVLFHNTVMNYFSVDARFFRSFLPLLTRPGQLAKKFVSGKRLTYLHPAQFYLFASIVFFFIFSISMRNSIQQFDAKLKASMSRTEQSISKQQQKYDAVTDSLETVLVKTRGKDTLVVQQLTSHLISDAEQLSDSLPKDSITKRKKSRKTSDFAGIRYRPEVLDSLYNANASIDEKLKAFEFNPKDHHWSFILVIKQFIKLREKHGGGLLKGFLDTIPISMFFLIPIFALLLKILYRKRGRFAHHMVFSFYFFAFVFLASSIIILSNYIVEIPNWIDLTLVLSMFFYLLISLKHFYEQKYLRTFFKSILLLLVYMLFVVPFSFAVLIGVTFLLY